MPLVSTYLAKGIVPDDYPSYMISTGQVATKTGVDTARAVDLLLFLATNYEFGSAMFSPETKFIDVNINPMNIASRHPAELGVLAYGTAFLDALIAKINQWAAAGELPKAEQRAHWLAAAQENKAQWQQWIAAQEDSDKAPRPV